MNKLFLIILFFTLAFSATAQSGEWTWIHGPQNALNPNGNYGTKGVAAATNIPPSRYQAAYWKDLNGNFWIFGGVSDFHYNDLWKFDPSTLEWTWVHGPQNGNNNLGNYGSLGISSPLNIPPARSWGANCWTGEDGKLYLFGGSLGGQTYNDLWQYDIPTNEWTWIAGSNTAGVLPNHGTKGIASSTNDPGGRTECKSGWTINNELWMFGGISYNSDVYNDLWKYDLSTNLWTWESGSNSSPAVGNYGTLGIPAASNVPPARASYTKWGRGANSIYIFGGLDPLLRVDYNDVWEYDLNSKLWTWLGGSSVGSQLGSISSHCTNEQSNIPQSRFENQTVQTNNECSRAFWSFGGFRGLSPTSTLNDLWIYDSDNNRWIMVWGDLGQGIKPSSYGSRGVSSSSNAIPERGGLCIWTDDSENVWVFGGLSIGASNFYFNDMWRFVPDTNCFNIIAANSSFNWPTEETSICPRDTATFNFPVGTDITVVPNQGALYDISTGKLYLSPDVEKTFSVTAKTPSNHPCPIDETRDVVIVFTPNPIADFELSPAQATQSNAFFSTINNSTNADSYKWTFDGNVIGTDKDITQTFSEVGYYCITLEASNACGSDTITNCAQVTPDLVMPNAFTPNGDQHNDIFRLINPAGIQLKYFRVFNRWGQQVFFTTDKYQGWDGKFEGVECEIGTYFYIVCLEQSTDEIIQGDVTLIR